MPLSTTDQLQEIGDAPEDQFHMGKKLPGVRLAVCRALKHWEQAEEIARTLIRREPGNVVHVVALAEVMGHREGPVAAAAVYEFAIDRFPNFAPLRVSLAVELVKAGQIDDAKRVVKMACELDPDLRLVVLDHPGLSARWWQSD